MAIELRTAYPYLILLGYAQQTEACEVIGWSVFATCASTRWSVTIATSAIAGQWHHKQQLKPTDQSTTFDDIYFGAIVWSVAMATIAMATDQSTKCYACITTSHPDGRHLVTSARGNHGNERQGHRHGFGASIRIRD